MVACCILLRESDRVNPKPWVITGFPLQANVPSDMAAVLITLIEGQVEVIVKAGFKERELLNEKDNEHEIEIPVKTDISETEKERLIKERRGQGVFKTRCKVAKA